MVYKKINKNLPFRKKQTKKNNKKYKGGTVYEKIKFWSQNL